MAMGRANAKVIFHYNNTRIQILKRLEWRGVRMTAQHALYSTVEIS
jgi:hypothetical protein